MVKKLEKKKEKVPFIDWFLASNGATSVAESCWDFWQVSFFFYV